MGSPSLCNSGIGRHSCQRSGIPPTLLLHSSRVPLLLSAPSVLFSSIFAIPPPLPHFHSLPLWRSAPLPLLVSSCSSLYCSLSPCLRLSVSQSERRESLGCCLLLSAAAPPSLSLSRSLSPLFPFPCSCYLFFLPKSITSVCRFLHPPCSPPHLPPSPGRCLQQPLAEVRRTALLCHVCLHQRHGSQPRERC